MLKRTFLALLVPLIPFLLPLRATAQPLRLFVSSDLHYKPVVAPAQTLLIEQMRYSVEIITALFEAAQAQRPDALVLLGDLTNDGRMEEHRALAALLEDVERSGVPVYVLPGNHDLWQADAAFFRETYASLGYDRAFSQDAASLSYAAALSPDLWLILLDTVPGGSTEGEILPETVHWLAGVLDLAAQRGATAITCSHHNVLAHSSPAYSANYEIQGGDALRETLLDYRVPLHLSGHRHGWHYVTAPFTELIVGMPVAYPTQYAELTVEPGAKITFAARPLDMAAWGASHARQDLADFDVFSLAARVRMGEEMADGLLAHVNATDAQKDVMRGFFRDVYVDYARGTIFERRDAYLQSEGYRLWKELAQGLRQQEWLLYLVTDMTQDYRAFTLPL